MGKEELKQKMQKEMHNIKRKMELLFRQASRARKIYRKHNIDENLHHLLIKEAQWRELYNIYWYEYYYNKI